MCCIMKKENEMLILLGASECVIPDDFCVVCSEKSSGHSLGGGAERTGAADDERGGQSKSGLATQLPHPQHVQRGPRGHLHQGGRCQTLAGQRSVVILSLLSIEITTGYKWTAFIQHFFLS